MADSKTCEECKWCLLEDYGYSSYTVEGTQVYCLKQLHPSGREGFDRWYGDDERMNFANECIGFTPGSAVEVDVDREEAPWDAPEPWWHYYTDDDEQRRLIAILQS